jgi:N-acetylmuramoyl-L-alanine amidase
VALTLSINLNAYENFSVLLDDIFVNQVKDIKPVKKPTATLKQINLQPFKAQKKTEFLNESEIYIDNIIKSGINNNSIQPQKKPEIPKKITLPVIVIDAGHGGKDPGAIGQGRVYEKNIVLKYATTLKKYLEDSKKYKVVLTRAKDKYIPLRKRIEIARKHNADMFISLHADAATNKKARGLSIYTLSEVASDKEAAELAKKENKIDIVAGIDLTSFDSQTSDILIDLSFREAKNKSISFAKTLLRQLKGKYLVRKNSLHSAGFVVLKNSNMASVLIELGYLTNHYDTKKLNSMHYRNSLMRDLVKAIDYYFKDA